MTHIAVLHTLGDGLWSSVERAVYITKLEVPWVDKDEKYGELRVYFDVRSWNIRQLGLIYTDSLFEFELKEWLKTLGYDPSDIGYSEQGMQEVDYVSLDAGPKFMKSWMKQNEVELV